ncbi:hypothetical protein [Micromonospora sp. WMMD710]|uniref:hypothetical protein n=1 Tax=Micromonospora sp. WMMD710 TaxID=3016085 RepID=UPI002416B711|nr:hypothetical protein [Micromonospora sp. WMMD710]MDG4760371.1 hypothetical protein [Micromonospora sp. WMMD710]
MNRSTLIGVTNPEGAFAARLLHLDHPHAVLPLLRTVWQSTLDGNTAALADVILRDDWAPPQSQTALAVLADAKQSAAGIDHYADPHDAMYRGHIDAPVEDRLEWLYLVDIATDSVQVYEATRRGRWLRHSVVPLDPDAAEPVLGCGGYARHGHQWDRMHLWLPHAREGLDAEICLGHHPHATPVLRFTDALAQQICAATTASTEGRDGPRDAQLHRVGIEFDLMWPHRWGPRQRHRLRRDAHGLLLLDNVPNWSWRLLPTSSNGASQ